MRINSKSAWEKVNNPNKQRKGPPASVIDKQQKVKQEKEK